MNEGVRGRLCSSCSHRNVCSHKDDYLNMVNSLKEIFYKFPENEREFMRLIDPDCKFHSKELSTHKIIMQGGGGIIPENADGKSCAKMIAEKIRRQSKAYIENNLF